MDSIKSKLHNVMPLLLREYVCECGERVRETEFTIPIGPLKGTKTVQNVGCKCDDLKLAAEALQERAEREQRRIANVFEENSLINDNLKAATFANFVAANDTLKQAGNEVYKFAKGQGNNLMLYGTFGIGKSHLAAAATKVVIEQGKTALFVSTPKLFAKIRESYDRDSEFSEADVMKWVERVDVLVADDLGAEYGKDEWLHEKFFQLLDARQGKRTLYTTNLNSAELQKKLGPRNFSRLMHNTNVIVMNGDDYRLRGVK